MIVENQIVRSVVKIDVKYDCPTFLGLGKRKICRCCCPFVETCEILDCDKVSDKEQMNTVGFNSSERPSISLSISLV